MSTQTSYGICLYCNKQVSKAQANRHMQKHISDKTSTNKPGKSFLLKIEPDPRWGSNPYFLSVWVDGNADMGDMDDFLRAIWLECCGHLSAFTNKKLKRANGSMWDFFEAQELLENGKTKACEEMMEEINGEIPKDRRLKDALRKDMKIDYDYDFGSTTKLQITVFDEYPVKADDAIVLLTRNEPPVIVCQACGKAPAAVMCTACYDDDNFFCAKCAKQHAKTCGDFEDYAGMPVVNSPRMGVCGYTGGSIDKKRDGAYKNKRS
ncbi:hypothetical protein [Parafilimonas sp.]|uniref:hypothetical protein n=1 Tax=Parafilimonas sp. TaxID=1969739 RepID=UPI0039E41702